MRLFKIKKQSCFVINPYTMKLMMYLGNDLIEAVPLELGRISKPGYLGNFKRILKLKHNELIQQYDQKPEFLVIEPAPAASRAIGREQTLI